MCRHFFGVSSGLRLMPAVLSFLLLLPATRSEAAKPPHRLKISVGAAAITVERAAPGERVLLIGYERFYRDYTRVFRRVDQEATADGGGSAHFALGREIVPESFWVAIDQSSAAYAAATADGKKLKEGELAGDGTPADGAGRLKKVVTRFDYVDVLVVRAGAGSWQLSGGDGSELDGDGALDGKVQIDAERLEPRPGTTRAAEELRDDDLLIVFVPRQMGFVVAAVKK